MLNQLLFPVLVTVIILCDTGLTSLKPLIGRRACSPSRMPRCSASGWNFIPVTYIPRISMVVSLWGASTSQNGEGLNGQIELRSSVLQCRSLSLWKSLYIPNFYNFLYQLCQMFPESECIMVIAISCLRYSSPIPFTLGVTTSLFPLAELEQICTQGTQGKTPKGTRVEPCSFSLQKHSGLLSTIVEHFCCFAVIQGSRLLISGAALSKINK